MYLEDRGEVFGLFDLGEMATKVPTEKDILEIEGEEEKRPGTRRM